MLWELFSQAEVPCGVTAYIPLYCCFYKLHNSCSLFFFKWVAGLLFHRQNMWCCCLSSCFHPYSLFQTQSYRNICIWNILHCNRAAFPSFTQLYWGFILLTFMNEGASDTLNGRHMHIKWDKWLVFRFIWCGTGLSALRKQQDAGLFQPSPYVGYPFFMIPDLGNLCNPYLANGALTSSARTVRCHAHTHVYKESCDWSQDIWSLAGLCLDLFPDSFVYPCCFFICRQMFKIFRECH